MSADHPLLVSLHQALRSSGVTDNDVHFILDWIRQDLEDVRFNLVVVSAVTFVVGVIVGIFVARFA